MMPATTRRPPDSQLTIAVVSLDVGPDPAPPSSRRPHPHRLFVSPQLALPHVPDRVPIRHHVGPSLAEALRLHVASWKPFWRAQRIAEMDREAEEAFDRKAEAGEEDEAPTPTKPAKLKKKRKRKSTAKWGEEIAPPRVEPWRGALRHFQPADPGSLLDVNFAAWILVDHGAHEQAVTEAKAKIAAGDPEPAGGWDAWIRGDAARRWAEADREARAAWEAKRTPVAAKVEATAEATPQPTPEARSKRGKGRSAVPGMARKKRALHGT